MRQDSFNSTAYKILFLLLQLEKQPMTLNDIHEAFTGNPNIGKAVSQDSIGLYLNTLRAIGCEFSRPCPSNEFHYGLLHHPYSYTLTTENIQLIQHLRSALDGELHYWEYFHFNAWLSKIIQASANPNKPELIKLIFGDLANTDWQKLKEILTQLEQALSQNMVLQIYYNMPEKPLRKLNFLPQRLLYRRNTFYVSGYGEDYETAQILRLERISGLGIEVPQAITKELLSKKQTRQVIIARLINCPAYNYPYLTQAQLNDKETVEVDPKNDTNCIITIETDNEFMVSRHLLSLGYAFQVLTPQHLKESLTKELTKMKALSA